MIFGRLGVSRERHRKRSVYKGYADSAAINHAWHHPDKPEWPIEGNDVPFLCLSCNHMFNVDSEKPRTTCTKCHNGIFEIDKGSWKISCVAWGPMIAVFRDAVSGQCYLILPSSKCVMACMAPNHGQNIAKKQT